VPAFICSILCLAPVLFLSQSLSAPIYLPRNYLFTAFSKSRINHIKNKPILTHCPIWYGKYHMYLPYRIGIQKDTYSFRGTYYQLSYFSIPTYAHGLYFVKARKHHSPHFCKSRKHTLRSFRVATTLSPFSTPTPLLLFKSV
jgi:hypothetical protein